jgi:hypothetical protein
MSGEIDIEIDPGTTHREGDLPTFGPQAIPFMQPGGEIAMVACSPAANSSANLLVSAGRTIGVFALALGTPTGLAGIYAPLSADELRGLATSFLQMADRIDGGKGKQ